MAGRSPGGWPGKPLADAPISAENLARLRKVESDKRGATRRSRRQQIFKGEAMSERWLLYDAGCSVCAALAREVEALRSGRPRVRNLRDPEVQAMRNQAHPGWRWDPMLRSGMLANC
jgi:hypothetical protein